MSRFERYLKTKIINSNFIFCLILIYLSNRLEYDDDDEPQYNNPSTSRKRKSDQGESEQDDENGESSQSSRENGAKKKRRKEFLNLNATFMAGVPGTVLVTDQVSREGMRDVMAL